MTELLSSGTLKREKETCDGNTRFQCDACKKTFAHIGNLKRHKRTHTREESYQCNICGNIFSRGDNLLCHKKLHTKKQHQCDVCNKQFSQASFPARQKITDAGNKPHECNMCRKKFSHCDRLLSHQRTQTGENECNVCKQRFLYADLLEENKRTHTGGSRSNVIFAKRNFLIHGTYERMKQYTREKSLMNVMCVIGDSRALIVW